MDKTGQVKLVSLHIYIFTRSFYYTQSVTQGQFLIQGFLFLNELLSEGKRTRSTTLVTWKKRGWMVYLLSNRKKRVSRKWTRVINFKCCCCVVLLIEGGQPNSYAENISFCQQQSSLAVLHPSSSLVVRRQDSKRLSSHTPGAFKQDLNNQIKMTHPGQLHNVLIYMLASV